MRTPLDNMKKADKRLFGAMIGCLGTGMVLIVFVLRTYLKHDLELHLDKPVPDHIVQLLLRACQVLTFVLCPVLAVGFIAAGFTIWDYRRKRGSIKEREKTDA